MKALNEYFLMVLFTMFLKRVIMLLQFLCLDRQRNCASERVKYTWQQNAINNLHTFCLLTLFLIRERHYGQNLGYPYFSQLTRCLLSSSQQRGCIPTKFGLSRSHVHIDSELSPGEIQGLCLCSY